MKLFGGKKGGKHSAEALDVIVSNNEQEVLMDIPVVDEFEVQEVPEITVYSAPEMDSDLVQESTAEAAYDDTELKAEEIADAFGISVDDLLEEPAQEVPVSAALPVVEQKLSRKEKKALKKADKQAAKLAEKEAKVAEKKARKEAKKWSWGKKILVFSVLIFAVLLTAFAGYVVSKMWKTESDLDIYSADFQGDIVLSEEILDYNETEDNTANIVEVDASRKEGCYTFMVAGRDVETGLCDVVIVGRFDTENGTINMVSIPRDTMINKGNLKINTAYLGDLSSGGNGVDGLLKEVKKICGFDIDSWAVVDIEAVAKLIDAVGGVYFDVPMDMKYKDGAQGLVIDIDKGYQLLSGEDAVKVLRFRKGYPNGDLGRIQTQHDLILALAEQMLDLGNIPNLGTVIDVYKEHVQTNLTAGNVLFYAKEFLKMDFDNIQFVDMPQMRGGLVNGQSFIFININGWLDVVNEYLNPFKEDITQRNVSIKSSGDAGESFIYSAGA